MTTLRLTRRRWMAWLGGLSLGAWLWANGQSAQKARASEKGAPQPEAQLLTPLKAGSVLGAWRVQSIGPARWGALRVELLGKDQRTFALDICVRDRDLSAPKPPAQSEHYDIFVANRGKGALPTVEDQGLAAMALAEVIRSNEQRIKPQGLLTLRQRLREYAEPLRSHLRGSRSA